MPAASAEKRPECIRPRCTKKLNLDNNQRCGGHACPVPICKLTKSNKEKLCEKHQHGVTEPLPKNFARTEIDNIPVFLNTKTFVAQYDHPGPKGEAAMPRTSAVPVKKHKKGQPVSFCMEPQPSTIPHPWEQMLYAPDPGKHHDYTGALLLFLNTSDGTIQKGDPRPQEMGDEALPEGWARAYDDDGDEYFVNHDTGIMTYDDPRDIFKPEPSPYLMSKGLRNLKRRATQSFASFGTKLQWKIGSSNANKYEGLDLMLVDEDDIPVAARNKRHNRYMDILPNPRTRVVLDRINDDPESEYVNANYVRGADGNPQAFIAAMGPKATTVNNFWRMIWQTKPPIVVMITGLIENGKEKCERYWPGKSDGKTMFQFGDIRVMSLSTETKPGYTRTVIKSTNVNEQGKRVSHTLEHFWYNTWPDHGVPRDNTHSLYTDGVLDMLDEVNSHVARLGKSKKPTYPILVHCSAGVGRTGTYIAIDHEIKLLASQGEAKPLEIVETIRQDRCALVQHVMQFQFVHEAAVRHAERSNIPFEIDAEDEAYEKVYEVPVSKEAEQSKGSGRRKSMRGSGDGSSNHGWRRSSLMTTSALCLNLGTISFEGEEYEFLDPDGNGCMSKEEAALQNMPDELFDMIDKTGKGGITAAMFKKFQRDQARSELTAGLASIAE